MCNEGELLEKFNIQLAPVPLPELTAEVAKAKNEGTEVAEVEKYFKANMIVRINDNELENVAALKVAMSRLIKSTDATQSPSSAGMHCRANLA